MLAARRSIASLASRPATYTLPGRLARRSFAESAKPTKPADSKSASNGTVRALTAATVGVFAVYFFFLAKPEAVGSVATNDPEKAKNPKRAQNNG